MAHDVYTAERSENCDCDACNPYAPWKSEFTQVIEAWGRGLLSNEELGVRLRELESGSGGR